MLTIEQKAWQLQMSPEVVRRKAREFGGIKLGGIWRFTWDGHMQAPQPPERQARNTAPDVTASPMTNAEVSRKLDELLGKPKKKREKRRS